MAETVEAVDVFETQQLENTAAKSRIRTLITEQTFGAGYPAITGINLCGCAGLLEHQMTDRGAFSSVPVRFDSVEQSFAKFKAAVCALPETSVPVHGDFYDAAVSKITVRDGIGTVRYNKHQHGKYNFLWLDLCNHATKSNLDKFARVLAEGTQDQALVYITVQLTGRRVPNGCRGLVHYLGYEWNYRREPKAQDIRRLVLKELMRAFAKHHILTKYRKMFDVVYTGGWRATMLTLGFYKGKVLQLKRVQGNWTQESKSVVKDRMDKLHQYNAILRKKLIQVRRLDTRRKLRKQLLQQHREEASRHKVLMRETVKILADNGWSAARIGDRLEIESTQVRAYLAQYAGKLAEHRQFVVPKAEVTGNWMLQRLRTLGLH